MSNYCKICGENVGYLGKVVEFIYCKIFRIKMFKHKCEPDPVILDPELGYVRVPKGYVNYLNRQNFWYNWSQQEQIQEVLYPEFRFKKKIKIHKFIKNG